MLFIIQQASHSPLSLSPSPITSFAVTITLIYAWVLLCHYSLMMVAVCYRNVSHLASVCKPSRCLKYLATQAFSRYVHMHVYYACLAYIRKHLSCTWGVRNNSMTCECAQTYTNLVAISSARRQQMCSFSHSQAPQKQFWIFPSLTSYLRHPWGVVRGEHWLLLYSWIEGH